MARKELTRILYAEDEPDIQTVARLALEMVGGFTVKMCDNGQALLQAYADFAPDLIMLDVMMPGLDGPATLAALREQQVDIPVVFMTAKVQPQEIEAFKEMGALDVIAKPFDPMQLAQQVRSIWEKQG